jgi:hypothetical protein
MNLRKKGFAVDIAQKPKVRNSEVFQKQKKHNFGQAHNIHE